MTQLSRTQFEKLDQNDSLAPMRNEFSLQEGLIYLDGNSLGVLPKNTANHVSEVIQQQWGVD